MDLNELQTFLVQVVMGVYMTLKTHRKYTANLVRLAVEESGHGIWIRSEELVKDSEHPQQINGELHYHHGEDGHWTHGYVSGNLYLQDLGKCPFEGRYVEGKSMVVEVSKNDLEAPMVYSYKKVGEFVI